MKALSDVKGSTVIAVWLSFPSAKAFAHSAVLCVSGQVERARLAGISVRVVGSQGTGVPPLVRDWKLVTRTRKEKTGAYQRVR